eukprot:gene14394-biopygen5110
MHASIPPHERARQFGPPPVQQALQDGRVRHGAGHVRPSQAPPGERTQRGARLSPRPPEAGEHPRGHR